MRDGDEILAALRSIKNQWTRTYLAGNSPFPLGTPLLASGTSLAGGTPGSASIAPTQTHIYLKHTDDLCCF